MSSGDAKPNPKVDNDLTKLAPKFRAAVEAAIAECAAAGLDAMVYEAHRSAELQALYYQRGRTIIPPKTPVTNAPSQLYSWHGFGLAVDVVHRKKFWSPPEGEAWFRKVAAIFKAHGCKWGGDWTKPDLPHMQWGPCKPSPSDLARSLMAQGGVEAVWRAVGADGGGAPVAAAQPVSLTKTLTLVGTARIDPEPPAALSLSKAGADLIKYFESCMAPAGPGLFKPYVCPAGVLTVGWGHTNAHGRRFKASDIWTQAECDAAFAEDMAGFEAAVRKRVSVPLTQGQFDALVSFTYNCGEGNLAASTLLRKLNAGDYEGAAVEFHRWTRGGGKVLKGLVRRRAAEALMFQGVADVNFDGVPDQAMPQKVEAPADGIAT